MASSLNGTGVTFSNGSTQAVAWPGNTGTVTSVATGNGLTGGTITSSGTISLDVYTGSAVNNTSFPIGSHVLATSIQVIMNVSTTLYVANAGSQAVYNSNPGVGWSVLAGTWRARGSWSAACLGGNLYQRTA